MSDIVIETDTPPVLIKEWTYDEDENHTITLTRKVFCKECKWRSEGAYRKKVCRQLNKINPYNGEVEEYRTFDLGKRNTKGDCKDYESKPPSLWQRLKKWGNG